MGREQPNIRANLQDNSQLPKSKSPRHAKGLKKYHEPFSIDRPLTKESSDEVWHRLGKARHDIAHLFGRTRNSPAELVVPASLGVVIVPRQYVRAVMAKGLTQRFEGLKEGRMLERLETHTSPKDIKLETLLGKVEWREEGSAGSIVYTLEPGTAAVSEVQDQASLVSCSLVSAKAGAIEVSKPDHFTLFKYGCIADGVELTDEVKVSATGIIEAHFAADANLGYDPEKYNEIRSIYLGSLSIYGKSGEPYQMIDVVQEGQA